MRKISLVSLISIAAMLLIACDAIENTSIDSAPTITDITAKLNSSINVSQNEASGIADMFMRSEAGTLGVATKSADTKRISSSATVREDGQDLMYVFNYEDGGFVIVGSTRNYYPILAYSDKGSFVLQDDMGPVDVWLDETKVSIKNSSSLDEATKAQMQNLWARYDGTFVDPAQELLAARRPQTRSAEEDYCWDHIDSLQALYGSEGWTFLPVSFVEDLFTDLDLESYYDAICYSAEQNHSALSETVIGYKYGDEITAQIGPLIGTEWYQGSPFGSLCPNLIAGCGPVAAGQLMFFYQYPDSLSWANETFTWDDIPSDYFDDIDNPTPVYKHSLLMRLLGQEFNVVYHNDSTSSCNVNDIVQGLISLGYYAYSESYSVISSRNELFNNHRPLIMRGVNTTTNEGHFWVCEGAKESLVNQLYFYTENQPYGAGTFTQGMYSHNNPGIEGGNMYLYFYMCWGLGGHRDYHPNGWFVSNNVSVGESNYQNYRKNIYVIKLD